eukprot:357054-Chlamydomonas_euryale.AAC.3
MPVWSGQTSAATHCADCLCVGSCGSWGTRRYWRRRTVEMRRQWRRRQSRSWRKGWCGHVWGSWGVEGVWRDEQEIERKRAWKRLYSNARLADGEQVSTRLFFAVHMCGCPNMLFGC